MLIAAYASITKVAHAASSSWQQADWSGGPGQTTLTDDTRFSTSTNINYAAIGQLTIAERSNWYSEDWLYRKQITFDNSEQSTNLVSFPVLVELTTSNFDFSKAQSDGEDIRFADSDGITLLNYEIEKWDEENEEAWIWVNVPQVNASSTTDNIYMYYENSSAIDDEDPNATWNPNYKLVYHLEQTDSCPLTFLDSTINNNDGYCEGTPTYTDLGEIDGARSFNDFEWIYALDSTDFTQNQMTVSLWANQNSLTPADALASKWYYNTQGSWAIQTGNSDASQLQVFIANSLDDLGDNNGLTSSGAWSTGWHHVVFTFDGTGSSNSERLKIYIDGVQQTLSFNGTIPSTIQNSDTNLRIGDFGNLHRYWNGDIDEVRISTNAQTPDWIAASYKTENNTFNTFGSEEGLFPSSSSLTSSIFDTTENTSFDTLIYSVTTPSNTNVEVKVRTSNSSTMSGAPAFGTCTTISSGADMSANSCVTDSNRYIQYQVLLSNTDNISSPTFNSISLNYTSADPTPTPTFAPTITPTPTQGGGSGSQTSSPNQTPSSCTTSPPALAPHLYQISSTATSSTLYFTPTGGNTTGYTISYGTTNSADQYAISFNNSETSGAVSYTINALTQNTMWYFKVRANSGCATGAYSPTSSSTTTVPQSQNIIQEIFNNNTIAPIQEVRKVSTPTPTSSPIPTHTPTPTVKIKNQEPISPTTTAPEPTTQPQETASQSATSEGYDLSIKISSEGKPLGGAGVEIHSKVQKTIASSNGIASFTNVEPGEHTVKIAYKGYTGEHKIALTGNEKEVEMDLSIKLVKNEFASPLVFGIVGVLLLIVIIQALFIYRKMRTKNA